MVHGNQQRSSGGAGTKGNDETSRKQRKTEQQDSTSCIRRREAQQTAANLEAGVVAANDVVDDAVALGLQRRHVAVAVRVLLDLPQRSQMSD